MVTGQEKHFIVPLVRYQFDPFLLPQPHEDVEKHPPGAVGQPARDVQEHESPVAMTESENPLRESGAKQ
jgi:hypothetical protein